MIRQICQSDPAEIRIRPNAQARAGAHATLAQTRPSYPVEMAFRSSRQIPFRSDQLATVCLHIEQFVCSKSNRCLSDPSRHGSGPAISLLSEELRLFREAYERTPADRQLE